MFALGLKYSWLKTRSCRFLGSNTFTLHSQAQKSQTHNSVSTPVVSPCSLENLLIRAGWSSKNRRPLTPAYLFITGEVFLPWILSHRDVKCRGLQCSMRCKCTHGSSSLMGRDLQEEPPISRAASHQWQRLSSDMRPSSRTGDAWSAFTASELGAHLLQYLV